MNEKWIQSLDMGDSLSSPKCKVRTEADGNAASLTDTLKAVSDSCENGRCCLNRLVREDVEVFSTGAADRWRKTT